ncbi:MAG: hypothetical protein M3198_17095 [Actinomycetota bacterium]|nr:hypothetical protein [Actinomycetota bacterium]
MRPRCWNGSTPPAASTNWLLGLLDGTDDILVDAVARALRVCGIEDGRNADVELAVDDRGATAARICRSTIALRPTSSVVGAH